MKTKLFLVGITLIMVFGASAQQDAKFSVSMSTDSILLGNYFQVKFTLENAQGSNFSAPSFEHFNIISGPNTSSNFSMINGEVNQSISYTYYLEPKDIGNYYIEPASIDLEDAILETQPKEVMVVPNPDGIRQEIENPFQQQFEFKMDDFFSFPDIDRKNPPSQEPKKKRKKKKKRKTYKI